MGLFRQGYPVSFWPMILTDKNEIMASLNANFDHISLHFKLTFLHNTVKDKFLYQGIGITEKNQFNGLRNSRLETAQRPLKHL